MSSFPYHEENVRDLQKLGVDVSNCLGEKGEVTYESWGYDEQVELVRECVNKIQEQQALLEDIYNSNCRTDEFSNEIEAVLKGRK